MKTTTLILIVAIAVLGLGVTFRAGQAHRPAVPLSQPIDLSLLAH